MALLSKCPLCNGVMPNGVGESRCPRCGELVLPIMRKLCSGCGRDVTHGKRSKDAEGNYLCPECVAKQIAERGDVVLYTCQTCGNEFTSKQVYQLGKEIICKACYAERTVDPNELLEDAAQVSGSRRDPFAPRRTRTASEPDPFDATADPFEASANGQNAGPTAAPESDPFAADFAEADLDAPSLDDVTASGPGGLGSQGAGVRANYQHGSARSEPYADAYGYRSTGSAHASVYASLTKKSQPPWGWIFVAGLLLLLIVGAVVYLALRK